MQKRKTHFEQVPIGVAENALRQQSSRPKTIANGSLLLMNPVPLRVGTRGLLRRRLHRYFMEGSPNFHPEEKLLK
jgi:hypothetical protein